MITEIFEHLLLPVEFLEMFKPLSEQKGLWFITSSDLFIFGFFGPTFNIMFFSVWWIWRTSTYIILTFTSRSSEKADVGVINLSFISLIPRSLVKLATQTSTLEVLQQP